MLAFCLALVVPFFIFMYHWERNGNPLNLGDFGSRCLWSASMVVGYIVLSLSAGNTALIYGVFLLGLGFAEILIPHGFAMNMGRRTGPYSVCTGAWYKYWPALPFLWIKNYTVQDVVGMASTGLLRGLAVFLPALFFGYSLLGVMAATILTSLWQAGAYYVGWYIPFSLPTTPARTATWGEFLVGAGWALALAVLVCL